MLLMSLTLFQRMFRLPHGVKNKVDYRNLSAVAQYVGGSPKDEFCISNSLLEEIERRKYDLKFKA